MNNNEEWYTIYHLLSYTRGIFYFADTVRNIGKTWLLQKYAWRRAFKHDKKCVLIRRTKDEAMQACNDLYDTAKKIATCKGLKPYDKKTKKGNFKQNGRCFYIKRNGKWEWFLRVLYLSECKKFRGFGDERCDRIFYDEYVTTNKRRNYYIGNEVEDLIDLLITISRQHRLKVIFFGNKENVTNPYYSYFNIKPLPVNFEGIRTFRKGTIVIQQYNQLKYQDKEWEQSLKDLLEGTPYGEFMFHAQYKDQAKINYGNPPADAQGYAQFVWDTQQLKVTTKGAQFFVSTKADLSTLVLVDRIYNDIRLQKQLSRKNDRNKFRAWQQAYLDNRIRYQNQYAYDTTKKIMKWFGMVNN